MQSLQKVVTRFAPSPTGNMHCGAYRTGIFAYLYARKHNGTFILRIEDTDKERNKKEYEDNILDSLSWLGLEHDVFVRQSENVGRHREVLKKMVSDDYAYVSKEEAKDGSGVMKEIVRFRNPNIVVSFHDEIKGEVTMDTTDLGDFVIAKNISEPLFHLAVVVDDFDEEVTHVIRGEDHVSNTPRQILIQRAIGAPTPVYAHLPLVLGTDKQKLSKRKGALALTDYRKLGYLPEALLNMVSMLGWNPGTEQELFSKEELVREFDLTKVQKSPAVFNEEKLNWFNRKYIENLTDDSIWNYSKDFIPSYLLSNEKLENFKPRILLLKDRIDKFSDIKDLLTSSIYLAKTTFSNQNIEKKVSEEINDWSETSFLGEGVFSNLFSEAGYYFESNDPQLSDDYGVKIVWKDLKNDTFGWDKTKKYLSDLRDILSMINTNDWEKEVLEKNIMEYANSVGKGNVLYPFRYALSGKDKSPGPIDLAGFLGKETTIRRIDNVIKKATQVQGTISTTPILNRKTIDN